jgi:Ca2+-transporting ATPase
MKNTNLAFWWTIPREKILSLLGVDIQKGLSDPQVIEYRKEFGSNTIAESEQKTSLALVLEGIKEPMMLLLLSIALLSLLFGKIVEAIAMVFVVLAYISVEFINKYRTEKIMTQLKSLSMPTTKVIRDGKTIEIKTTDLVVGDIIIISEGVLVPADARLLSSYGLMVNEASLTGESLPIEKNADAQVAQDAAIADRINSVFSGTTVLSGEGTALVIAVGKESEFGKIAQQVLATRKEQTILQEAMTKLAKVLAIFALVSSALIPAIGFLRGLNLQEMILTWLSLTFLMIPGQPPIIITMALALAAFVLAQKHIIVKRLRGVEIIGQVSSIISDKTGTITESVMVLETFYTANGVVAKLPEDLQQNVVLALPDYSNDPTDKAVFEALEIKQHRLKQVGFVGFADNRPWRDLIYQDNSALLHAIAGSPELIIAQSHLSEDQKKSLAQEARKQASLGKRVTAYAFVTNKSQKLDSLNDLNFVALAVISDPVRNGVKQAIATLEKAHVKTYIVTGDHKATAQAIAQEIGITGEVISGDELANMSDADLVLNLKQSNIFARMDPSQKVRLVKLLQQNDEIVAVIGDGVNDAPALKAAHVGIAMGQIGTDLAKEVSDLILTDDNYVHVPDAIAAGRTALDNFKKGLSYYLSAKCILLIIFLVPLFLGIPFPFAPIQIILIELLMDLASSTIFVTEAAEPNIMQEPVQRIKNFLGKPLVLRIVKNSIPLAAGILFIYLHTYHQYEVTVAQTAAFVSWLLGHILLALNLKQRDVPLIKQGIFSNYFGTFWLLGMIALSLAITMVPPLYPYLKTAWLPISVWAELLVIIGCATFWIEVVKSIKLRCH